MILILFQVHAFDVRGYQERIQDMPCSTRLVQLVRPLLYQLAYSLTFLVDELGRFSWNGTLSVIVRSYLEALS